MPWNIRNKSHRHADERAAIQPIRPTEGQAELESDQAKSYSAGAVLKPRVSNS